MGSDPTGPTSPPQAAHALETCQVTGGCHTPGVGFSPQVAPRPALTSSFWL